MLSQTQRATILELHAQKIPKREIARLLKLSRHSVRQVLKANSSAVPKIARAEKATPYRSRILEVEYAPARIWSFAALGEVCRKGSWNQRVAPCTGLSRPGGEVCP